MKFKVINILTVLIFWKSGSGVRITPKLDFDSTPGIRTDLKFPRSDHRVNYQNSDNDNSVVVKCSSGCNPTNLSGTSGVSTDVVVHVQTNVNVPKTDTKETVSEVPVILGTNDNNNQRNDIRPVIYNNNVPSVRPNYAPISPTYQQSPIYQTGVQPNYRWPQPQLTWYPKQKGIVNYHNPLEFKKVYTNTWPNFKLNTDFLNQLSVNLPKLNLNCFPQNQPSYTNINPYPSASHIDDKIASLNK